MWAHTTQSYLTKVGKSRELRPRRDRTTKQQAHNTMCKQQGWNSKLFPAKAKRSSQTCIYIKILYVGLGRARARPGHGPRPGLAPARAGCLPRPPLNPSPPPTPLTPPPHSPTPTPPSSQPRPELAAGSQTGLKLTQTQNIVSNWSQTGLKPKSTLKLVSN